MKFVDRLKHIVSSFTDEYIPTSDPRILDLFNIPRSDTGEAVTPDTAMRVSAVYACVALISGIISTLPLRVYQYEPKSGTRKLVDRNHDIWFLLNQAPFETWTAVAFWQQMVQSVLLWGDGFAQVKKNQAGLVTAVKPYLPQQVAILRHPDLSNEYHCFDGYRTEGVQQEAMLHFTGPGFNGMRSMSVISYAAFRATGISIATDRFAGKFFANGSMSRIVIEVPKNLTEEQVNTLRQQFSDRYAGLDNAHKPLILTNGGKAAEVSMSAADSQLLQSRQFQVIEIARSFGVPPILIGDHEKTSSWGTGIEQIILGFTKFTIAPKLRAIEHELNRKIFPRGVYEMSFDMEELMRGDSAARAAFNRQAIGGSMGPGWMTPNEVRQAEGLPPDDGDESDVIYQDTAASADPATDGDTNAPQKAGTDSSKQRNRKAARAA